MRPRETFTPAQSRAARGLLDWTTAELSKRSGIDRHRIESFEQDDEELELYAHAAIGRSFAKAGVIAKHGRLAGDGVRFRQPPSARDGWALAALSDFLTADDADEA
ncbi:hypothetical protein [Brevundimonas sp.]|uniref:hypothetical protein n=1 Tax=Brevundimonas sp. TaxID=1871086 RepID=UPI00286BE030|nr:hypothetical protein [Brevundimonas sp.]